jgi:hypothetical protein
MPNVSVFNMTGKKVSDMDLAEEIFGVTPMCRPCTFA